MPELAGRYRLGDVLGTGGTSTVYRATDVTLGVERAVKVLRGEGEGVEGQRARLRAEARAMARVTHPNILRVYDVGTDDGQDFFVMELADGGTLQDRVDAEGPLPARVVCQYGLQVLGALAAAHDAGVIHRDVKPQNVLLDREGVALLADFGIALLADGRESRHTRVGVAMGSMSYMPPEQRIDARGVGVGADVYATGATLYAALTGATPVDLFLAPAASARWDDVPALLRPVLQRATRLAPGERYPSARDMAAAVGAAMARLPAASSAHIKDEAAWSSVRDRVLASLAAPSATIEAFVEVTIPSIPRIPTGPAIPPTMESPAIGLPKAPRRRRSRRRLLSFAAVLLLLAGVGAGTVWSVLHPSVDKASSETAGNIAGMGAAGGQSVDPGDLVFPLPAGESLLPATPVPIEPSAPVRVASGSKRRAPSAAATRRAGDTIVSPTGSWRGSWNGKDVRFEITGPDDSLRGTVTNTFQGNQVLSDVRGRYDRATRTLSLSDVVQHPDSGRYIAKLTEEPALEGRFEAAESGRVVPFRVVPVE